MRWLEIVAQVVGMEVGGGGDPEIAGVQYDSRRVRVGDVFVAMRGGTVDGNRFVEAALERGAVAVVTDSREVFAELTGRGFAVGVVGIEAGATAGRRALSEVSAAVFGHPERRLKISAVTGTNGKTTTAFLLEQMLRSVGRKCLLLGTIETHVGDEVRVSEHTTPESRDVLALFAEGVRVGCTEVVMEMSSHALEQERVWGLAVDVAVFTNLTQDHLDYHGTMEKYARAKARLFAGVGGGAPRVAVINDDADYAGTMMDSYAGEEFVVRYGTTESANHRAEEIEIAPGRTRFRFVTPVGTVEIASPLTGRVNVENLMAAMCAALARGLTLEEVRKAAAGLRAVPGRFEVVKGSGLLSEGGVGFTVVVDYAHTEDALANLIALGRDLVGEQGGRVITMFGCGGDRDRGKRAKMGRVAGAESDLVVVTSDNPRSEEPMAIIEEVMVGVRAAGAVFIVEEDRRVAIEVAICAARVGDIVLLAGKGHEKTQTFAEGVVGFDDVEEAGRVLRMVLGGGKADSRRE
jgi:UDP-N-acetylmuramoyl-L-alanyl-D-glutamate--2,6-diaminopimelate ligase